MIQKLKDWFFKGVIVKKVIGKFAKHATGVLIALISGPQIAPWLDKLGISIDSGTMEAGLIIILTGLFGSLYNYIEHRFVKKK